MFAKESLYVNAIKYKSQLKINYKKLENNNIVDTNSSTFIAKEDILGRDIASKLTSKTSEINNSYISTLLLQDDTRLVRKSQTKIKDYTITSLNSEYNIAVSKNTLFETKNYFEKCGVDYIFSAYHVLNLHIEQNPCNNNLVVLLFNNQAFCIVLNDKGEIVFNKKIDLTPFEEIQDSDFYENEVLGQKLYDEVYALELYEVIKDIIEEFYSLGQNIFIEKVALLYNLKLVSEEQIKQMSDEFMIDVTYHPISVDEELFELSKDTHTHKSFISPRKKPNKSLANFFISVFVIASILAFAYFYIPIEQIFKQPIKEEKPKLVKEKEINLPNHIQKNSSIEMRVLKSLETIPYDVVLNELTLEKDSLHMDINLLNKDTFIKVIQPELQKSYKQSEIEFKESENLILEAVIRSKEVREKDIIGNKDYKESYIKNEFMPIIQVTEQIKILFPENTIVTFKSNFNSDVVTFNYLVNVVIQRPLEFFDIVSRLNNELYSVNMSYPLSFIKTEAGIEVEFILQFHQPK